MIFFACKGWIRGVFLLKIMGLFVLGGAQGLLGWYMVKSGLVDRPDVSQYRLAAHLGLALIILASVLWVILDVLRPEAVAISGDARASYQLRQGAWILFSLIFLTILSGAFVAGLDAGLAYNTFPLMDGNFVPDGLWDLSPTFLNLFENTITVQFDHRILAFIVVISVTIFFWRAQKIKLTVSQRLSTYALLVVALSQAGLGISTLLLVVPIPMAAMHQLGAVILLAITTWLTHEFRPVKTT